MSGCGSDDVIPEITPVPERYSNIEDYYEFSIQDGEAVQYNIIIVIMYICYMIKNHIM